MTGCPYGIIQQKITDTKEPGKKDYIDEQGETEQIDMILKHHTWLALLLCPCRYMHHSWRCSLSGNNHGGQDSGKITVCDPSTAIY